MCLNAHSDLKKKREVDQNLDSDNQTKENTEIESNDTQHDSDILDKSKALKSFKRLNRILIEALQTQLKLKYFTYIQSNAIPVILKQNDVLIRARPGSGKTLAYVVPIINSIISIDPSPLKYVILVLTSDLCRQVASMFENLITYVKSNMSVQVIGRNIAHLAHETPAGICISTPKTFIQYLQKRSTYLDKHIHQFFNPSIIILDDLDIMLSLKLYNDIKTIFEKQVSKCVSKPQIILCCSEINDEVTNIKSIALYKPVVLKLEDEVTEAGGRLRSRKFLEYYMDLSLNDKFLVTYSLITLSILPMKVVVYTNSIDTAYKLYLFLKAFSIQSSVLSEELPYELKRSIIGSFNQGLVNIFIIAMKERSEKSHNDCDQDKRNDCEVDKSHSFNLKNVGSIINFDFPCSTNDYIYRTEKIKISGPDGVLLSFITKDNIVENSILENIIKSRKEANLNLDKLGLEISKIECFRYRVEDVLHSISKKRLAEARATILRQYVLKNKRVQAYLKDHPMDGDLMKKSMKLVQTVKSKVEKMSLKQLPSYFQKNIAQITTPTAIEQAIQKLSEVEIKPKKITKHNSAMAFIRHKFRNKFDAGKKIKVDGTLYKSEPQNVRKKRFSIKKHSFKISKKKKLRYLRISKKALN